MNVGYLGADWQEFEQCFPSAYNWLLQRSLEREKEILTAELARHEEFVRRYTEVNGGAPFTDERRPTWIKGRLAELEHVKPVPA